MRNKLFTILALALVVSSVGVATAHAQAPARSVVLTWQDSNNPVGTTYNIWRNVTVGPCTTTPQLQTLTSAVTTKTYTDLAVKTGDTWCYAVTAVSGGLESTYSNTAQATVKPFPPQNLAANAP